MMNTKGGVYLFDMLVINEMVCNGEDMETAVWVNKDEEVSFTYFYMLPKMNEVLL